MVDGFWLNKANIATQPLDNQSHRSNFGKHIESCFDLLGNTLQTRHKKCLQSQDKTALTCLKSETCSIINLFQEKKVEMIKIDTLNLWPDGIFHTSLIKGISSLTIFSLPEKNHLCLQSSIC